MNKKIKKILEKKNKSKIVSLTAYSKNIAKILDNFCDIVLVGDSMANVLYGLENTHKITLENIIQHTLSVKKGIKKSLLVVDMPKNSYTNSKNAEKNARLIMRSTGCDAVKLESNKKNFNIIQKLVMKKIPVMGHLGLLPQSETGKFRFKGKKMFEKNKILNDAKLLEAAGVFLIVLECIETSLAKLITKTINIPTIGIGASQHCDGQILVTDDLIGLNPIKVRFVKQYSNIKKIIKNAVLNYSKDVSGKKFPKKQHSY